MADKTWRRRTKTAIGVGAVSALLTLLASGAAPVRPPLPTAAQLAHMDVVAVPIAPSEVAAFLDKPTSTPIPVSESQAIAAVRTHDSLAASPFAAELVMWSMPGTTLHQRQPAWILTWQQPFDGPEAGTWLYTLSVVSAVTGKVLMVTGIDRS